MFTCSPESQLYVGLYQKKCDQQVEGGDSAPTLHSCEIPFGVLPSALGPPTEEGPAGGSPEKGHKDGQRAEAPLL